MNVAREQVARMQADLEQGKSPGELEAYIREAVEQQGAKGWFARTFLHRSPHLGEPWEVVRLRLLDAEFLHSSAVFEVNVAGDLLETRMLPSGGSSGIFALGRRGFSYLTRRHAAVEALFGEERPNLQEADASQLAQMLAATLWQKENAHITVLSSAAALKDFGRDPDRHYELDDAEFLRVREQLTPPTLVRSTADTYRGSNTAFLLTFCGVYGWMHQQDLLLKISVEISDVYRLTINELVLSKQIFSSMPVFRY